jgi:hypothetical protein
MVLTIPGGGFAAELHVPGDYPTLQIALEAAPSGTTIRVAAGAYSEALTVQGKSVVVRGAGADLTVLDGTGLGERVLTVAADASVVLAGLTVQNAVSDADGGAVLSGGALSAIDCRFIANTAFRGGAITSTAGDLILVNCTFTGNGAWSGGAVFSGADATLINCVFWGNGAEGLGGGVAAFSGRVTGCTFVGNTAGAGGGLAVGFGGTVPVANSILWGNTAAFAAFAQLYSGGPVTACNVEGGWEGEGNVDSDPRFADVATGDLRLAADSPCRNAGHNAWVPTDLVDLDEDGDTAELLPWDSDGLDRVAEGIVDMGAYEFQPAGPTPSECVRALQEAVRDLVAAGVRLPANGRPLTAKLEAAAACLIAGDPAGATEALTAFHNQVRAFGRTGRLSVAAANALMAETLILITQLGG